jgi:hypothetical protein
MHTGGPGENAEINRFTENNLAVSRDLFREMVMFRDAGRPGPGDRLPRATRPPVADTSLGLRLSQAEPPSDSGYSVSEMAQICSR